MKLTVGFLCYNQSSAPYLKLFLESLERSLRVWGGEVSILAGDNSDDGTSANRELIKAHNEAATYKIDYLDFQNNLGFAAAYNKLIGKASLEGSEYFLMLNPDMLIDEQAVKHLIQGIEDNADVAVLCPKILQWDFQNKQTTDIIDSCGIMMKPGLRFYDLGQGKKDDASYDRAEIFGASGAAGLYKLSALNCIKENGQYFDERFFMYKEDCDLAYRLRESGFNTKLVPESLVYHDRSAAVKGGLVQTTRDWFRRSRLTRSWSFVNQHLLFIKHLTKESVYSRFLIYMQCVAYLIFSLILAQFLLKSYPIIWRKRRVLTNTK
ncbi:MAG: glycosyltransferase family 2 protein [bacterium]|nr:glycosyltransferase family 2 protein [bacterium]